MVHNDVIYSKMYHKVCHAKYAINQLLVDEIRKNSWLLRSPFRAALTTHIREKPENSFA